MESRRLSIPIYLNQRIVFDLLAVVEDGFTQLQTVKRSESGDSSDKRDVSGEVGIKNVFAFLNLGIKGTTSRESSKANQKEIAEERVYTPTSLFSKLRDSLIERKLLTSLDDETKVEKLTPGSFVEFSGILKKNPMVACMEGVTQTVELSLSFMNSEDKKQIKAQQDMLSQMRKFLAMLKQTGSLDLVASLVNSSGLNAVIPVQLNYFSNESPADIIDGQFVILGKVARYIAAGSTDSINLTRGTPLAYLPTEHFSQFISALKGVASLIGAGEAFTTQIPGPVFLVIPIAIYA